MDFENCQIVDTETWIQDLPFSNQQGASVDPMWLKLYSAKYDLLQFLMKILSGFIIDKILK